MWKFNIHIDRELNTVTENGRYAAVVRDPTIISRGFPREILSPPPRPPPSTTTTTTTTRDRSWQTAKSDGANCEYRMSELFATRPILICQSECKIRSNEKCFKLKRRHDFLVIFVSVYSNWRCAFFKK